MSDNDISITISANPQQAVQSIELVNKEAKKLSETEKQVNQSAMSDTSNTVNQVLSVGRAARREFEQTGTAVGGISTGIRTAASEAGKVAGAFGKSIPVIGQLGSAIASALTGPIGAISAAIGLAIAGIQRLIADAEARVERLKLSAAAKTGSAYDALMKGRSDYAAQLQVLAQVREINKLAQGSALSADELAEFRQLASQIGIAERDVGARGIRSGKIAEAERTLKQQRRFYSDKEYQDYLDFAYESLQKEIAGSSLASETKDTLKRKSLFEAVDWITANARRSGGNNLDEFKAYQSLYGTAKQINDVRSSYNLDAMLGRSQAEINTAAVDAIRNRYAKDAAKAAAGSGVSGAPAGSLAAANEQAKREASGQKLLQGIEREIEIQKLINDGKQREAFILQNRLSIEAAYGRELYAAEYADLERRAGLLYDLRHPEEPDLAPEPGAVETPERTRARQVYAMPLDRLQRIGANTARAVTTPEKLVLDKSLSVQEQIRNILAGIVTSNAVQAETIMRF